MANKKRDRNGYRKQLGRYKLSRADILAIEKILWEYADARELKIAGVDVMPDGRKHMPRKFADRNVKIGRYRPFYISLGLKEMSINYPGVDYIYDADSVKFLPKHISRSFYLQIECHPGIAITFRPFSTEVYAQTQYATGKELMIMRKVVEDIEGYVSKLKTSAINVIDVNRRLA
jgi:hypothetical protein